MKNACQLLLLGSLLSTGCGHAPLAPDRAPPWVTSLISQLEAQPVANPPAFIAQYEFQGATVYYVPPHCCDVWSTLYRADGSVACHPDGGITGTGDGACPTFLNDRKNEQIVWRDPRAGS